MAEYSFAPTDLCDDLVCCSICFEPFVESRNPKALPCLHTFCESCLEKSIEAHKKNHQQSHSSLRIRSSLVKDFPCPICKEPTKIPENGLAGFKDDFRIRRISELFIRTRDVANDVTAVDLDDVDQTEKDGSSANRLPTAAKDGKTCEVCKCFSKQSPAMKYCMECSKLLCDGCAEKHLKSAVAKDHLIFDAKDATVTSTNSVCTSHPSEILKYFCCDCNVPLCMPCTLSEEHSSHSLVKMDAEVTKYKEEIENLLQDCREKSKSMSSNLSSLEFLERTLITKEKNASKAIVFRTLEEIYRIRNKQNKLEEDLEQICQGKHRELRGKKEQLQDQLQELNQCSQFTEKMILRGQDVQILSIHEEIIEKLQGHLMKKLPGTIQEETFPALGKYDDLIDESEASGRDSEAARQSILTEMRSVLSEIKVYTSGRIESKAELLFKLGKKGQNDGEFNFPSGAIFLPNGDAVVADLHNQRVQIFSADGKFKSKFGKESFKPCGLAVTKDGYIAVTDCNSHVNCIKIYSPDGTRKAAFGYGEFDYPFSIAVDSQGRLIVCDSAVSKITIMKPDGSIYRRFSLKTKFPFYIAVNQRDEILVSDWYNHCIKIFDTRGRLLRTIGSKGQEDGQLLIPLGLCVDKRGNIFVTDCKNERVSAFSADGKFIKHVLNKNDGIEYARALSLSRNRRLIVTYGDNKRDISNEIRVYQI